MTATRIPVRMAVHLVSHLGVEACHFQYADPLTTPRSLIASTLRGPNV